AVGKAMGINAKKLMASEDAPRQWCAGNFESVFEYVKQDARMTNLIVAAIRRERRVRWITTKGDNKSVPMPRLKRVHEVLCDPEPDQSWMDRPLRRARFCEWIPAKAPQACHASANSYAHAAGVESIAGLGPAI